LASVLLFLFLDVATRRSALSLAVAVLFAVHPTHVESVAWISERKDVLSALLGFASLWAWVRYARQKLRRDYGLCALFLALGLLAKQMLVTWPFLFLLLNRWPLGREESWRDELREQIPMLGICVAAGLATIWAQAAGGALVTSYDLPLVPRLANAAVALWTYPKMLLWPAQLSVLYPHPYLTPAIGSIPTWQVGLASAATVASVVAMRYAAAAVRFGLSWYLITVIPVIGVLQMGPQSHADRYTYIPAIGIFLALAWALRGSHRTQIAIIAAVSALCVFGTRLQLPSWTDDEHLYGQALANTNFNWLAAGNLSSYYLAEGRAKESEQLLLQGLGWNPNAAILRYNMGNLLGRRGELDAAAREYESVLEREPKHYNALNNLARIQSQLGDEFAAVELLRRAHDINPAEPNIQTNLANSLRRSGRAVEARQHLEHVLEEYPCHVQANDVFARLEFDSNIAMAIQRARKAVECSRASDALSLETLARCEERGGNHQRAELAAQQCLALATATGQNDRVARMETFLAELGKP